MARPKDADSAETYERIVGAALEALRAAQPRTAVSMRAIAEGAGVSLGTLQYYFENKDALLEACLDGYYERLGALGMQLFAYASADPDQDVEALVRHVMRELYRFVCAERALIELRLITNALRGELHPMRQDEFLGRIITDAARWLAPKVGRAEVALRLSIQTLSYAAVHMALLSPSETETLLGDASDAERVVEDHVVETAVRLLCAPAG